MFYVKIGNWKIWFELFWALIKIPGILVIGKCITPGIEFLLIFIKFYG